MYFDTRVRMNRQEDKGTTVLEEGYQQLQTTSRKCYTVTFKLQVICEAKLTAQRSAARRFGVNHKQLRAWISDEEKLVGCSRMRRLDGAGRKPANRN